MQFLELYASCQPTCHFRLPTKTYKTFVLQVLHLQPAYVCQRMFRFHVYSNAYLETSPSKMYSGNIWFYNKINVNHRLSIKIKLCALLYFQLYRFFFFTSNVLIYFFIKLNFKLSNKNNLHSMLHVCESETQFKCIYFIRCTSSNFLHAYFQFRKQIVAHFYEH